jgi:UDP-glucuronate 4-epimerase
MGETILVTGGAGFIGSHLCDKLLSLGHTVICVDNLNAYYPPARKIKNIQHNLSNKNFHFFALDIARKKDLEQEIFQKFEVDKIVHLAARAGVRPSIADPFIYQEVNLLGTLNLLDLAKAHKVKAFIFGSSSSVYGKCTDVPFREDSHQTDKPISPYAATKKSCENYCHTYNHLYGMNITMLRFFTVYGPRGRPDMAPYLFTDWVAKGKSIKRFGDGTTKRDYTYVGDIVNGIVAALEKAYNFEIINLGNSKPVELNYFINVIEKTVGKKAIIDQFPEQQGDVPITYADVSKAKELLSYEPKVSIEEGMQKFYEWYRKEIFDHETQGNLS